MVTTFPELTRQTNLGPPRSLPIVHRRYHHTAPNSSLTAIGRGYYAELGEEKPAVPWEKKISMHLAHIRALAQSMRGELPLITGESALLLLGGEIISAPRYLHYYRQNSSRAPQAFCSLTHTTVPVLHHSSADVYSSSQTFEDLSIASPETAIIDTARWAHPAHAMAITSRALRKLVLEEMPFILSDYSIRTNEDFRSYEREIKSRLLAQINRDQRRSAPARARKVIKNSTALCESIQEARAWAILQEHFPNLFKPQIPVITEERTFFLDFANEKNKIGIEVDGMVKFRNDPGFQAINNTYLRSRLLQSQGWLVIHVSTSDLNDPRAFISTVFRALHR